MKRDAPACAPWPNRPDFQRKLRLHQPQQHTGPTIFQAAQRKQQLQSGSLLDCAEWSLGFAAEALIDTKNSALQLFGRCGCLEHVVHTKSDLEGDTDSITRQAPTGFGLASHTSRALTPYRCHATPL